MFDFSTFYLNNPITFKAIYTDLAEKLNAVNYDRSVKQSVLHSSEKISVLFLNIIKTYQEITSLIDTDDYSMLMNEVVDDFMRNLKNEVKIHQVNRQTATCLLDLWVQMTCKLNRSAKILNNPGFECITQQLESQVNSFTIIHLQLKTKRQHIDHI